jgi:hypothetical protein
VRGETEALVAWRGARLRPVVKTPGGYVGQAALDRTKGPRAIFLGACMATNFFKQAAPANDSTRDLSLGA